jgi:hypothetical protein
MDIKRRIFLNFLLTIGIFMLTAIFLLLSQFAVAYQPFLQITDYIQGLFGFNNPFFYVLYPLSLNIGYGIMILIVLAAVLIYSLIKSNDALLLLLIWCGVIFIFFSFYGGSELYRYLLPAFPALYIIIANFFINTINSNLKYFKIPNKIFRKIVMIGLIGGLIAFVGLETYVGEYFIVRRSKTYQGVYNSSNWLLSNVNSSDNIMAPSNSLSQLEFYTQSIFDYYSLSGDNDWPSIENDLKNKGINYVIISVLQYPETQALPICNLIHFNLSPIYNSTDGNFITYIFNTTHLL